MSYVGKTMVKGHGLLDEGVVRYDSRGQLLGYWRWSTNEAHAMCRCGELSPAGISQYAAKKWHRQHKADVTGAQEQ